MKALHAPTGCVLHTVKRTLALPAAVCPSETLHADSHGNPSQALGVLVIQAPQRHAE